MEEIAGEEGAEGAGAAAGCFSLSLSLALALERPDFQN